MFNRFPFLVCFACALAMTGPWLQAALTGVEGLGQREAELSEKRVESRMWESRRNTELMKKNFPIEAWDKHFSSVGSKRAPITLSESKDKKIFKTREKKFPKKEFEMSRWNQRMVDLHEQAGISTDDRARKIADRQLYTMLLQDTKKYGDLAEPLSLRDINRFQFRHNRSDGAVPIQAAGAAK